MVEKDDIVFQYLDQLREENKKLKEEVKSSKKRPASVDFSKLKDIAQMIYDHDGWTLLMFILTIGTLISVTTLVWRAQSLAHPETKEPPRVLTQNYHLQGYDSCYFVVQEYSDGDVMRSSPCIKSQDEALKLKETLENNEHKDIRSLQNTSQQAR